MHGGEALSTIAEVGLGLAGFTGILVALGRSRAAFSRAETLRLLLLLVSSFGAMFLALLPFALHESGVGDAACWQVSSLILAGFTSVALSYLGYRTLVHRSELGAVFSRTVFVVVTTGSVAIVLFQVINALALLAPPRSGPYVSGLVWLLFIASLQFARILFVRGPGLDAGTD